MLRALLESVTGRSKPAPKTPASPTRFAPALQPLEAREVPAVVAFGTLADFSLADPAATDPAATDAVAKPTGKVIVRDLNIMMSVSKSSTSL